MNIFNKTKVSTKLISIIAVTAMITIFLTSFASYKIYTLDRDYSISYENNGLATGTIGNVGMCFNEGRTVFRDLILAADPDQRAKALQRVQSSDQELEAAFQALEAKARTEKAHEMVMQFKQDVGEYRAIRDKAIRLAMEEKVKEAWEFAKVSGAIETSQKIDNSIDGMYKLATEQGNTANVSLTEGSYNTIYFLISMSVVLLIASLVIGLLIVRKLIRRLNVLGTATEEVAKGNLTKEVKVTAEDEIGALAHTFEKMRTNMLEVMINIDTASGQVAAGAKNVSDASISLSQGATEQASSVEELSSSIEEISAQTKLSAQNANKVNELTSAAKLNAENGNHHMQEMLNAMREINGSSSNISKIIKVIDEIAFQTNILALNAAVEAARAGQHGKGFAVVAEEVRNLAARSAKAAKETTDMIEGSIEKVNDGTHIANKTAEALGSIVGAVAEVSSIIENIATASNEQSLALDQINQGVLQVSQVVQANSATSEEAASASEELSAQAELLKQTIGRFNLGNNGNVNHGYTSAMQAPKRKNTGIPGDMPQISLSDDDFGKY